MEAQKVLDTDQQFVADTYARFPLVLERGKGARVTDADGREYIDMGAGIGVNSLGFADDGWIRAVTKQLGKMAHCSNLYYSEPCGALAKELCARTGMAKAFFCNSGAEANEAAIKWARGYSEKKYGADRSVIVTLGNSFHGRTLATLSATGQEVFHKRFGPMPGGFRYAPADDAKAALEILGSGDVCAIMMEMIQGEGGVVPLAQEFVREIADFCRERDILILVDEVQTGVGRTGKFLCCEHYGLKPDIVTLAKGLGGGLPIGAALLSDGCSGALGHGENGSTFGGNPAVCAGALEVLARIDEELLTSVREKGEYLRERLCKQDRVKSVTGLGLMIGVELADGLTALDAAREAMKNGVIPLTAKSKLRLLPPLVIPWRDLEDAADILCKIL